MAVAGLALAVGLVLADSSIVVLALPEIYRSLGVGVAGAVWVLISFNLALALLAVPAARLSRARPRAALAAGLVVFAAAGAGCGLAGVLGVLLVARCLQAVGGAVAIGAALELLPAATGSEAAGARVWAAAGAAGAALGPAVGGALTELVSWQSIFFVQVPLALLALPVLGLMVAHVPAPRAAVGRPHLLANVVLALVSAALTAALFLIVLLMIEGWRLGAAHAALVVSVMPVAAVAVGFAIPQGVSRRSRAGAGAVCVAGGLGALAVVPAASAWWTVAPQVLVGAGLALTLGALTAAALEGRAPQAIHGGWTMASRHLGVVAGLALLTPVLIADLEAQQRNAQLAVTAVVLDASIPPRLKLDVAQRLSSRLEAESRRVPDIGPVFRPLPGTPADRPGVIALRDSLADQLERAATAAFARSFAVAGLLALIAGLVLAVARGRVDL